RPDGRDPLDGPAARAPRPRRRRARRRGRRGRRARRAHAGRRRTHLRGRRRGRRTRSRLTPPVHMGPLGSPAAPAADDTTPRTGTVHPMSESSLQIEVTPTDRPVSDDRLAEILANPGFGLHFTDHMFVVEWTPDQGWHGARITPYGPLTLDPATAVLHYAQEIFEGMKAYRHADGSIWDFRPEENAARMVRSSRRLAFPVLEPESFVQAVDALGEVDQRWVPEPGEGGEKSLYVRPFMIATETFLGVRPSQHVTFMVIASPAGPYFKGGVKPLTLWLTDEYTRAGRGGMGAAKTGGNY